MISCGGPHTDGRGRDVGGEFAFDEAPSGGHPGREGDAPPQYRTVGVASHCSDSQIRRTRNVDTTQGRIGCRRPEPPTPPIDLVRLESDGRSQRITTAASIASALAFSLSPHVLSDAPTSGLVRFRWGVNSSAIAAPCVTGLLQIGEAAA